MNASPFVRSGAAGLFLGLLASMPGCGDDDGDGLLPDVAGDIAEQCGLDINCEAGGFAEGKASISGVASIDAFFGAAIDLDASMRGLSGELRAELDAIALSVGADAGASGADITAAIDAHLATYVTGGLQIQFQPAQCTANLEVSAAAAAECDASVDPGMVSARCEGSCTVEANAEVGCEAEATLRCSGTAPGLACEGTCEGSCALDFSAAAQCDGTCRGTCRVGDNEMGDFEGTCAGQCEGECVVEMNAGAMCEGACEGQCDWTPPDAQCEGNATARCEANAGASVECSGSCEGTAEPPSVSAECEATVEAKADASIECTPPSLDIAFEFNGAASTDLALQAEFRAWLAGFRAHLAAIVALRAKADVVVAASANLADSAAGAVQTAVQDISADANLSAAIGAGCALQELPVAAAALTGSASTLAGEVEASATVVGSVGG